MLDMRQGTCPICHQHGILKMNGRGYAPPRAIVAYDASSQLRIRAYVCRSCGFTQEFLEPAHLIPASMVEEVIGGGEGSPFR